MCEESAQRGRIVLLQKVDKTSDYTLLRYVGTLHFGDVLYGPWGLNLKPMMAIITFGGNTIPTMKYSSGSIILLPFFFF